MTSSQKTPIENIVQGFANYFQDWRIVIPEESVKARSSGQIKERGWIINYLFGEDETGEYLDFYAHHRMTNDRHVRLRSDFSEEYLPSLEDWVGPFDPEEEGAYGRAKQGFRSHNQKVIDLLKEKGFWQYGEP